MPDQVGRTERPRKPARPPDLDCGVCDRPVPDCICRESRRGVAVGRPDRSARDRLDALERAIVEHRRAIRNAGSIKVQSGYEPVAEAKQAADERLWKAVEGA